MGRRLVLPNRQPQKGCHSGLNRDELYTAWNAIANLADIAGKVEDLNVGGMVKDRFLARSLFDSGFFQFRASSNTSPLRRCGDHRRQQMVSFK